MISKNISNYDLVIFDCDGTLVNSEALCNQALLGLVNQYSQQHYTIHHALESWAGNTVSAVLATVEAEQSIKLPTDIAQRYVDACNAALKSDLEVVSGALDFVAKCAANTLVCVGSNGERRNVIDSLKLCDFSPKHFEEKNIFTRIQVLNGKPAPDLFLFAAEKMGVSPTRCLVIEDSPTGAKAGIAAGMDVLGFTGVSHDLISQEKKLVDVGVRAVFSDIIHMSDYLGL